MKQSSVQLPATVFVALALSFIFGPAASLVHGQEQIWLRQFGTPKGDFGYSVTSDNAGGAFATGTMIHEMVLLRYNAVGDRLWIQQFGTGEPEGTRDVLADGSGGVFLTGYTQGRLGSQSFGNSDAFLARYSDSGARIWIQQFGTRYSDSARSLASDGAGGVYVVGKTRYSLGGPYVGQDDVFVVRYDGNGGQVWARQFGTTNYDRANAAAPDGSGGVYVGGYTLGSLAGPNQGDEDAFLAHYDSSGNQLWIRQFGSGRSDFIYGMASDDRGGVFVTGMTLGNLGGSLSGYSDMFLARYDRHGDQLWMRQIGTDDQEQGNDLIPDGVGGVFVVGITGGNFGAPPAGASDIFLGRFSKDGDQLWVHQFGTSEIDYGNGIASSGDQSVFLVGSTFGTLGGTSSGEFDIFLARHSTGVCYADCDYSTGIGVLDIFDFLCWQDDFVTGNSYACDCDITTGALVCDIFDFLCFQSAFVGGCP